MLEPLREWGTPMGMDMDRESLGYCRDRAFTRVFEGRGHRLPLRSGSLDFVGAFDVLEHIREEKEALLECHRVIRPGGWFFISGPAYQFLYTHQDKMVDHQRRYRVSELRQKCQDAGFEVVKGSYINFLLFPVILVVLMFKKLCEAIRPPTGDDTRFNTDIGIPGPLNGLFAWLFSFERYLLRFMNAPTGHSLIVLARKPEDVDTGGGGTPDDG